MATTYTPNYHLGKQEDRSDKFVMKIITDNMDIIDEQLKATDDKATAAAAGLKYKGAVNYYSDLLNDAELGDAYTVLYAGSSGSVPDGTEYVWGELNGTAQWIDFSKDTYTKAEVNALLAAKQALLNANNKLDPAYINYDSTHRAVSDTEKSTWNSKQNALSSTQLAAANSGIDSTKVAQIDTNKNNISTLYEEGVINLVDTDDKTGSLWINIPIELPAGNYVLHFDTLSSTASGTTCQTVFFAADNSEASSYMYPTRGNNITLDVTVTKTTSFLRIYAGDSYAHSTGFTVEFTNLLVAKKESWEASSKVYQPYAMTNSELTAAIKALQAQLANQ